MLILWHKFLYSVCPGVLLLYSSIAWAHVSINHYDTQHQQLYLNIVVDAGMHQAYIGNNTGIMYQVEPVRHIGEYLVSIPFVCDMFEADSRLYYRVNSRVIAMLSLAALSCPRRTSSINRGEPEILLEGACILRPNGATLWRSAQKLAIKNGYSVYQNIYAIFLQNRSAFLRDDINKMKDVDLACPADRFISSIENAHAIQLFYEMLKMR